jgi:glutathione S-transferase
MTDAPSRPRLTYLDFRGLAEPIRLMFEDLGVDYEDRRVGGEAWAALKPQLPFAQVPLLEIDGRALVQSRAIYRYLARRHDLDGADEDQRIACDIAIEAVRDLQNQLWDHFWSAGSDAADAMAAYDAGALQSQLGQLEAWLGARPFFAAGQPLFADYYALTYLDEAVAFFPDALRQSPNLAGFRRRMVERPRLAAYIASGRQSPGYGFDPIRGVRMGLGK